jgi:hypothetical protein
MDGKGLQWRSENISECLATTKDSPMGQNIPKSISLGLTIPFVDFSLYYVFLTIGAAEVALMSCVAYIVLMISSLAKGLVGFQ